MPSTDPRQNLRNLINFLWIILTGAVSFWIKSSEHHKLLVGILYVVAVFLFFLGLKVLLIPSFIWAENRNASRLARLHNRNDFMSDQSRSAMNHYLDVGILENSKRGGKITLSSARIRYIISLLF